MVKCKELAAGIGLIVITTFTWVVTSCSQPVTNSISITPLTQDNTTQTPTSTTTTLTATSTATDPVVPDASPAVPAVTTTEPPAAITPLPAQSPSEPFDISAYRLGIDGMVNKQLSLSYAQILAYPAVTQTAELVCPGVVDVINEWTGVPLATLLKEAGLTTETGEVVFTADSGFFIELPLSSALQDSVFLAYEVDGQSTLDTRGYPLRLVLNYAPGYEWVKGITKIEVKPEQASFSDSPAFVQNLSGSVPASRKALCACLLTSVRGLTNEGKQKSVNEERRNI